MRSIIYFGIIIFMLLLSCSQHQEEWQNSNSHSPKILLFEVCPNPGMKEETEARDLYRFFQANNIPYSIRTNDIRWEYQTELSEKLIKEITIESKPEIIHLAIHGVDSGLVISSLQNNEPRFFSVNEMEEMNIWRDKIIVSGACEGGKYAQVFINQGAKFVIGTEAQIPWRNLGGFFSAFYEQFFLKNDPHLALANAQKRYPEYESYKVYGN